MATRDGKASLGPKKLMRRIRDFSLEFSELNPSVELRFCQILNRPAKIGSRIESHIHRFNTLLKSETWVDGVGHIEVGPFGSDCFNDGLHLSEKGTLEIEEILRQNV